MLVIISVHLPIVHWRFPGTQVVLDFEETVGIGAGLVVVILAVWWFFSGGRSSKRAVEKLLRSTDPAERIAGVDLAATGELERHVRSLRRLAVDEPDSEVLEELAGVVARHRWKPSDDVDAVELRVWAHRYYSDGVGTLRDDEEIPVSAVGWVAPIAATEPTVAIPAIGDETAPTAGMSPISDDIAGTAAVPETQEPTVVGPADGAGTEPVVSPGEPASTHLLEDKPCVLVTGAGSPTGVTVVRSLMEAGHRVVAADSDPDAVGLRLASEFQVIPHPDDPQLAGSICGAAVRHEAQAIISTVVEELPNLAVHQEMFDDRHLATWFPEGAVVRACVDNWLFYLMASSAGLPVPATNLGSAEGIPGPWIVRSRYGRASRDIMPVDAPEELDWALAHLPSPLVQSRPSGREFTVDALVARDGSLAGAVPRWDLARRDGITSTGETFTNEGLLRGTESMLRSFALRGPASVHGFAVEEANIVFTGVNPRFSGGLALCLAAGADFVGQYLNGLLDRPIEPARLRYRSGVRMLRYFDEIFEG